MTMFVWIGIALCLSQAAMLPGINLAVLGVSRLRLEVEAAGRSRDAARLLAMPRDANGLLATILWANVAANVLLTLLSGTKWVIITDPGGHPGFVLDAHHFLRDALLGGPSFNPEAYWHRPIVVTDRGRGWAR